MRLAMCVVIVASSARDATVGVNLGSVIFAEERHEQQAEHVERGDEGGDYADQPEDPASVWAGVCLPEDFVLAPKARQGRDSGDGEGGDTHGQERPWNVGAQAAHLAHVLFAVDGMDDGSGREEEEALEESVGHQVKDSGREGSDAAGHEHVAEL